MYVTFINGNGGGFANKIWVEQGTTVQEFLEDQIVDFDSRQFDIAVNGAAVMGDAVLTPDSRIVAAYKGQKGA